MSYAKKCDKCRVFYDENSAVCLDVFSEMIPKGNGFDEKHSYFMEINIKQRRA